MSRDTSGTLNIWMGRMIEFIPQSYDKRSRRWDLREIRDIEREGNNVLKVISSDGNKHTFDLRGKGMSADEFNMIRLQIGRRRIGR